MTPRRKPWRRLSVWALLLAMGAPACKKAESFADKEHVPGPEEAARALEALTAKAPVRFAWLDGDRLLGFDTLAPTEPVVLRQGPELERPLFAPDGAMLLFTEAGKIHAMAWPSREVRVVREGFAVATRRDDDHHDWVYAAESAEGKTLFRFPLREPSQVEPVWDAAPVDPRSVQFSRDGQWMSAAFFHRESGWADLSRKTWTAFAGSRPFGMVADSSRLAAMLDGTGRWLRFFNTTSEPWHPQAEDFDVPGGWRFPVPLSAPTDGVIFTGLRWSNHARFPLLFDAGRLALLKLSPDGRQAETTAALAVPGGAIREADAWIGGGEASSLEGWQPSPTPLAMPERFDNHNWNRWPFSYEEVAFAWRDSRTPVALPGRDQPCRLTPHQWGRYKENLSLWLGDSTYEADLASARALAEGGRRTNRLSVEFELEEIADQEAPISIRLIALKLKDGRDAFSLSRVATRETMSLVLRVLMDGGDGAKAREYQDTLTPLGPASGPPMHVVAELNDGKIFWKIDGAVLNAQGREMGPGRLSAWNADDVAGLIIGDHEARNDAGWRGYMKHIVVANGHLSADHIKAHLSLRRSPSTEWLLGPPTRLKAKLIEAAPLPPPEEVGGRFLVQQMYEVEEVISGPMSLHIVPVWHWARMDGRDVPERPTEIGKTYELFINRTSRHPELEVETVRLGASGQLEPSYFDLAPPGDRAPLASSTENPSPAASTPSSDSTQ